MELIAVILGAVCAALLLAVLVVVLRRPASAPAFSGDSGRLAQDLEDARAERDQERAGHAATRERLSKAEGDLREAAVHAGRVPPLEARLAEAEARANAAEKDLQAELTRAQERDDAHRKQIAALVEFKEDMKAQFKALSAEALTQQTTAFTETNKQKLEVLLAPLKTQIERFENDFKQDGQQRVAQRTAMETLVQSLKEQTASVQNEAGNLARALKGQAQTQGAWGEMILKTILEKAGLREGEEFATQETQTAADGSRHRPDVVVNFPDGKKLVIDSKVSLVAFERGVNCDDEAERGAHLKEHLTSLRRHIRGLSEKDYARHYGGVDFVILFVPVESALSLAIQNDPELQTDAVARNVMIASPNTLLMGLRTVQNMWVRERQNRNAEQIAERAGRLYEKFAGFVDDLEKIGDSLVRTRAQYDAAYGKLTGGPGNLVRQAELLKQMGARTTKQISDKTLSASDERDAAPDSAAPEAKPRAVEKKRAGSPESLPRFNDARTESYDELTDKEKQVAAAISQDWDA